MRVSKIVREYIEDQVAKKFPSGNTPEYDAARALLNDFENSLKEKVRAIIEEEVTAFRAIHPIAEEAKLCVRTGYRYVDWSLYHTALDTENNKHKQAMRERREKALTNILVTLELGGTRADLERMIAELE